MPLILSLMLAMLVLVGNSRGTAQCTIDWAGLDGASWDQSTNWHPDSGSVRVPGPTDYVCIHASVTVNYRTDSPSVRGIDADGTILVTAGTLTLTSTSDDSFADSIKLDGGTLAGAADLHVPSGGELDWTGGTMKGAGTTTIDAGGVLSVSGSPTALDRALTNFGDAQITVGLAGGTNSSISNSGSLDISGSGSASVNSFTQTSAGTLAVGIRGTGSGNFDQLQVAGNAHLGGTLAIDPPATFTPATNDTFDVLTFGSRSSEFVDFSGVDLTGGLGYALNYNPAAVTLTVGSFTAPGPPIVTGVDRTSPASGLTPSVQGTAPIGATSVRIYTNSACTSTVAGSGTAAAFATTGIPATAKPNAITTFYARALDSVNRPSDCSSTSASYVNDSAAPAVTLTAPSAGLNTTSQRPTFSGAAGTAPGDATGVTVKVYPGKAPSGSPVVTMTTQAAKGLWSVAPSTSLAYRTYTAQASQADSVGNIGASSARTFTVMPPPRPPTVTRITPSSGMGSGGTAVVITGSNLTGASAVKFGARAASTFSVKSATQMSATAPAGSGTVDVTVTTPGGSSGATGADRYAYVPPPSLAKSAVVMLVSGSVTVREPGAGAFQPIAGLMNIPMGSMLDTTHGRVRIIAAKHGAGTQSGDFWSGLFKLTQDRSGMIQATLAGSTSGCTNPRARHAAQRRLFGNAAGSFKTRARYGSATIASGQWLTEDRCGGTYFKVYRGKALVSASARHGKKTLTSGQSYLAPKR